LTVALTRMRLRDGRTLPLAILCVGALAARMFVGAHIADDAYITMRYSRNVAAAGTLSYNPPDPVLGTSSPLWAVLLAGGAVVGVAPETTALGVSCVADLLSIVLILTSPAGGSLAAIVAAATVAAWPAYVTYAVSGMETSFFVLTIVAFVSAASRYRLVAAAVAVSLAALTRPDGALLLLLGITWAWWSNSKAGALTFASIVAVICLPWTVYAWSHFGSVIPTSVIAKASGRDPWSMSLENVRAYFFQGPYVWLTAFALIGFVTLVKSATTFWRLWLAWAWSYLAAMTAANAFTHFPWYFVPLLPIYTAAAAAGCEALVSRADSARRFIAVPALRGAFAAVAVAVLIGRMPALKRYLDATADGRETLYAAVATELAAIDSRCTIAATEIGTIGYHYPGRVLDLVGLVSPEVLGRSTDAVLAESGARWIVSYDTHFDRGVATSERFSRLFERRSFTPVGTARHLEVYERRDPIVCR
jgi:hypothetical protein